MFWQVLNHLLYLLRVADRAVKRRVTLALAHLCAPDDCKTIFIDNNGINTWDELPTLIPVVFVAYVYSSSSSQVFSGCWLLHYSLVFPAGLELLLGLLESTSVKQREESSVALYKLATKATSLSPMDAAPPSPTQQVCFLNFCQLWGINFLVS